MAHHLEDPARDARLVRRDAVPQGTLVPLGRASVGGDFVVIAGPCAVESAQQLRATCDAVAQAGCSAFRGGAYKPRKSPRTFQGLGEQGLRLLAEQRARFGLPVVSELLDPADLPLFDDVDVLQIGARNMHDTALLKAVGRTRKPVLLKRGFAATIDEWLLAAEYVLAEGNPHVILCERGIRSFDPSTRNVLDLGAVVLAKQLTHLPVIVDPSHATGRRELVVPLSLAAAAAGADGLLLEVHLRPDEALCDGPQALLAADLNDLMERLPSVLGQRRMFSHELEPRRARVARH